MSFDAIVWLVVGIGVGIGACLMLLMLYAGLERWRLGRRLRRARVLREVPPPRRAAAAAAQAPAPAPAGSKLALLDRRREDRDRVVKSVPPGEEIGVDPGVAVAQEPEQEAQEGAAPVPAVIHELDKAPAAEVAPATIEVKPDIVEAQAVTGPSLDTESPVTPAPSTPRANQSVEDMFAEAFALDKVSVVPLKDE